MILLTTIFMWSSIRREKVIIERRIAMKNFMRPMVFFLGRILFVVLTLIMVDSVWAEGNMPKVVVEGERPLLVLPEALMRYIRVKFPDYRIPTKEDMTGEWGTYQKKDAVPYACWGDFNGDGLTDVALILIGKDQWRLVAFHQTAEGTYVASGKVVRFMGPDEIFYRRNPPQRFHIYTIKAGDVLKVGDKAAFNTPYQFDSIAFFLIGDPASGIHSVWRAAPESRNEEIRLYGIYTQTNFGALDLGEDYEDIIPPK